ncbi:MAG: type II toxin-antitoxin system VapC family toxin [Burkholderiaceae bacterium]
MGLLLDTHALLWWLLDSADLPAKTRRLIERASLAYVSSVSVLEIAIKQRSGKLPELQLSANELPSLIEQSQFTPLPVTLAHAAAVAALPDHHRDPFDHLLIAQAQMEKLAVVTSDPQFARYSVKTRW